MQWFCNYLRTMPMREVKELRMKTDAEGRPEVACFIEDLDNYLEVAPLHFQQ